MMSQSLHMYPFVAEDHVSCSVDQATSSSTTPSSSNSLLYSLCLLKEKVHQVEALVSILIAPDHQQAAAAAAAGGKSTSIALASMADKVQEIMATASSMMFSCQQMANESHDHIGLQTRRGKAREGALLPHQQAAAATASFVVNDQEIGQSFFPSESTYDWYGDHNNYSNEINASKELSSQGGENTGGGAAAAAGGQGKSLKNFDIIELDAADLLAKYTHYCQVCGKGFKRDANLRMHMRAHGDQYKSSAALSNPMKSNNISKEVKSSALRKYSCPQEGCRWNQKHAKFQPLKSMICVKNHYKRSHCPKMYVCKRCNRKQFSVLSDLRTHEKHCGDVKWQCSCGTTFSRKDKLMGHVALFVGHSPAIATAPSTPTATATVSTFSKLAAKVESQSMQMYSTEYR